MLDKTLTVIILNYQSCDNTRDCLESLRGLTVIKGVVVVDNDSPNKTFDTLIEDYKDIPEFHFVSTNENLGYAKGNNYGYSWAKEQSILGKYTAILNNDIEVPESDTFDYLINTFESLENAGVISPKIIHKATGIIQGPYEKESIFRMFWEAIFPIGALLRIRKEQSWRLKMSEPTKVYRTMGSFLLFDSKMFEKIGMFDERTFLGSEEEILSEKLKTENRYFYFAPGRKVLHHHGASTSLRPSKSIEKFFLESKLHYFKEYLNCNSVQLWIIILSVRLKNMWLKLKN